MNEVTRIHLSRQPFNISAEAHHALKAYLTKIEAVVKDEDVVNEVEVRMAELLTERGISGDKVVLPADVDFLKEQLGKPTDFSDDDEPALSTEPATKRLFRNTDEALLGGVSAGLASYFGLEVVLIRLIFIILTFFSGFGILVYIVLWLVLPAAKTASEKLQMQGKPVTVDALKESVAESSESGRNNNALPRLINDIFDIILKVVGIVTIIVGLSALFSLVAIKVYMLAHDGRLIQENYFPVGLHEQWLLSLAMILTALVAIFVIIVGLTVIKRRWPLKGWATVVLGSVFLIVLASTMALLVDVAPNVQKRYESSMHTTAVSVAEPFNNVISNGNIDIEYVSSPSYAVSLHYYDSPDISKIKFTVVDGTLHIDASQFDGNQHCDMLCLFPRYNMVVQVAAPNVKNFDLPRGSEMFYPNYRMMN